MMGTRFERSTVWLDGTVIKHCGHDQIAGSDRVILGGAFAPPIPARLKQSITQRNVHAMQPVAVDTGKVYQIGYLPSRNSALEYSSSARQNAVSDINLGMPATLERHKSTSSGWVRLFHVQSGPRQLFSESHALELSKGVLPWRKAVELDGRMRCLHVTCVVNYHEIRWWQTSFLEFRTFDQGRYLLDLTF